MTISRLYVNRLGFIPLSLLVNLNICIATGRFSVAFNSNNNQNTNTTYYSLSFDKNQPANINNNAENNDTFRSRSAVTFHWQKWFFLKFIHLNRSEQFHTMHEQYSLSRVYFQLNGEKKVIV